MISRWSDQSRKMCFVKFYSLYIRPTLTYFLENWNCNPQQNWMEYMPLHYLSIYSLLPFGDAKHQKLRQGTYSKLVLWRDGHDRYFFSVKIIIYYTSVNHCKIIINFQCNSFFIIIIVCCCWYCQQCSTIPSSPSSSSSTISWSP